MKFYRQTRSITKITAVIVMITVILGIFSFTGCKKAKKGGIPTVSVQLMTREGNDWEKFFNSPTINIKGEGSYSETIEIDGEYIIFPMIAISSVGTDVTDQVTNSAKKVPAEYKNATVSITSMEINGKKLELQNEKDIPFISSAGPLAGYTNVQLWNAWFKSSQRIVTKGTTAVTDGGLALEFSEPVKKMKISFKVEGVDANATPFPSEDNNLPYPKIPQNPEVINNKDEVFDISDGEFNDTITSKALVESIELGWNLGNTFDAYPTSEPDKYREWVEEHGDIVDIETAWINGKENATTQELFKKLKSSGFNAVRIPVTWYKMAGDAPDYTIDEEFLNQVNRVVNMAISENLYVIINTHNDEYLFRFEDPEKSQQAIEAIWKQIAERFKNYNEKLIFEGLNEPKKRTNSWSERGEWDWNGDDEAFATLNKWNQAFVNTVRTTGGNNEKRHLMITPYAAQPRSILLEKFELPDDPIDGNGTSRFILSIHDYSPHDWAHNGEGEYTDSLPIQIDLERIADCAAGLDVPVILGEWGTLASHELTDRITHAYDYVKIATDMRSRDDNSTVMACFVWDDFGDFMLISRVNQIDAAGLQIIKAMTRARNGESAEAPLQ